MPKIADPSQLRGRPYMWSEMARLTASRGGFDIADIHGATRGTSIITVKGYLAELRKVGAIMPVGARPTCKNRSAVIYRVTAGACPLLRQQGSIFGLRYQQIWTALRAIKGSVTARDLALSASTDDVPVKEASARAYLLRLARTGLCHVDRSRKPFSYRLLPAGSQLGPKAPVMLLTGELFNPNNGQVVNVTRSAAA